MSFFDPSQNGLNRTQKCPICGTDLPESQRYKDYVCDECITRAVDKIGSKIDFNPEIKQDARGYNSWTHIKTTVCYIDNKKCFASEAKFGGLVVQLFESVPKEITSRYEIKD